MGRGFIRTALATISIGAMAAACAPPPATPSVSEPTVAVGDGDIRINQIQLVGSHNSYHQAPEGAILLPLVLGAAALPGVFGGLGNPLELNYTHAPLPTQLERGIRTFELDVYADPDGGRFAQPRLTQLFGLKQPRLPQNVDQPGFKVLHIADVDFLSSCETLQICLGQIRSWSDAHPDHLPIVINIEAKGDGLGLPEFLGFTPIVPIDSAQLDAIDAELRLALGDRLITPDVVRGEAADLRTAMTTTGWPTLKDSRGKVLFFLDNEGLRDTYIAGHPTLEGRAMFTSSGQGQPDGAVLKVNDPGDGSVIRSLVSQGYIVRTRADADLLGDPSMAKRDTALASGAQIVHSDYPPGQIRWTTGYTVNLGTKVQGRCNPVSTTPATCQPAAVIEP